MVEATEMGWGRGWVQCGCPTGVAAGMWGASELSRAVLRSPSAPSRGVEAGGSSAEVTFSSPWDRGTRRVFAELRSHIRCPDVTQPGAGGHIRTRVTFFFPPMILFKLIGGFGHGLFPNFS